MTLKLQPNQDIDTIVVFVVGFVNKTHKMQRVRLENASSKDILMINMVDDYRNLVHKVCIMHIRSLNGYALNDEI